MSKEQIAALSERWHSDPEFRAQAEADPKAALAAAGIATSTEEAIIAVDTEDTVHFVFPPDPNADLTDDDLAATTGGSTGNAYLNSRGDHHLPAGRPIPGMY